MDAFVGQRRRIKWIYNDERSGVTDLTLVIRDESDAIVYTTVAQELHGSVYYFDWTPDKIGNYTGYFSSVTNSTGFAIVNIDVHEATQRIVLDRRQSGYHIIPGDRSSVASNAGNASVFTCGNEASVL